MYIVKSYTYFTYNTENIHNGACLENADVVEMDSCQLGVFDSLDEAMELAKETMPELVETLEGYEVTEAIIFHTDGDDMDIYELDYISPYEFSFKNGEMVVQQD